MLKHTNTESRARRVGANGFTLVELLVVIVILGILAAVVVFAVGGIQNRGQDSACETEIRSIKTAVEAYRAQDEEGDLPTGYGQLIPNYLESDPSARWTYTTTGTPATDYDVDKVVPGKCEDYTP